MDLSKIYDFLVVFGNDLEIVKKVFNIRDTNKLYDSLSDEYPETNWDLFFNKREKKKHITHEICGLDTEIEKLKNFLLDDSKLFLLIVGKQNSGKTLIIDHVSNQLNYLIENVFIPKDFIADDKQNEIYNFKICFIFDNFDKVRLHATKKRKFNKMLRDRNSKNKIIVTANEYKEEDHPLFDDVINMPEIQFEKILQYLKDTIPDLRFTDNNIMNMYREVNGDIYFLIEYVITGENNKYKEINKEYECLKVTHMIFKEINRDKVRKYLYNVLEFDYIRKTDIGKKISYLNDLESYLLYNYPRIYNPENESFFHNIKVIGYIKKRRYSMSRWLLITLLSYGIMTTDDKKTKIQKPEYSEYKKTRRY